MPPRLDILKHCWSSVDLPILPFLAPRVFQPWPVRGHRRNWSAARGPTRYQSVMTGHGYEEYTNGWGESYKAEPSAEFRKDHSQNAKGAPSSTEEAYDEEHDAQHEVKEPTIATSATAELSAFAAVEDEESGSPYQLSLDRGKQEASELNKEPRFITWASVMVWVTRERPGIIPRLRGPVRGSLPPFMDLLPHFPERALDLNVEDLIELWNQRPQNLVPTEEQNLWKRLMGITLARYPENALDVVEAISYEDVPLIAISDIIDCFVAIRFGETKDHTDLPTLTKRIFQICQTFPKLRLQNNTSRLMLSQLPEAAFVEVYNYLERCNIKVNFDTLHYFAYRFASEGNTDLAFHILQRIRDLGVDFNMPKVLSLVSSILHHARDRTENNHQPASIYEFVSGCDMKPNIITYNILILSTIRSGDAETAWKIHDMMVDIGIQGDEYTYSILFNDAKYRRDYEAIEVIRILVQARGIDSHVIWTDELHLIQLSDVDNERASISGFDARKTFDNMLSLYAEHFELGPLRRILTHLPSGTPNTSTTCKLHSPDGPVIGVMVSSFLRTCHSSHLRQFYQHFRSMVLARDPAVLSILDKEAYLYNMILLAYSRHPDLWGEAPSIVADMLPVESQVSKQATTTPHDTKSNKNAPEACIPPQPTVWTWSTLLWIFMLQGLPSAAHKVLGMMTRRGVKPNKATWSILLHGYARLNDPKMAAETVAQLQKAGYIVDHDIYNQMNVITDRLGLHSAMKAKGLIVDREFMGNLQKEVVNDVLAKRRRRF